MELGPCPPPVLSREESLLHLQTAAATPRAEVHWDEASTDGEEAEEEPESEDDVELSGNSGL